MGTASFRTRVKLGGTPTSFTDETVTYDSIEGRYQIEDSIKRVWNPDTNIQGTKGNPEYDLVIEVMIETTWTEIAFEDIESINLLFGLFTLDESIDPADASSVRVSGEYIPVSEGEEIPGTSDPVEYYPDSRIAFCDSYDLTLEGTVHDKTGFREAQISDGSRVREIGLFDSNASLTGFGVIPSAISDAFFDRDTVLIEIIPGNGDEIFRGWYVVETDSLSGGVDDLETSDMSFQMNTEYPEDRVPVSFGWSNIV